MESIAWSKELLQHSCCCNKAGNTNEGACFWVIATDKTVASYRTKSCADNTNMEFQLKNCVSNHILKVACVIYWMFITDCV